MNIYTGSMLDVVRASPLLDQHYDELTQNKDIMSLDPDWERYGAMERYGITDVQVAYDGDQLAAYSISFIGPHIHYRNSIIATNDVLFLAPAYRQGTTGLRLMAASERAARGRGAALYLWHAKPGTPLDRILRAKQLPVQDTIYGRRL